MVYLCIRKTLDWSKEDAFWAQLPPEFALTVRLWNATFVIPYHLFRHRVREIIRNANFLPNVTCLAWNEVPDGALVLPADDDDWFAPEVSNVLKRVHEQYQARDGYYWRGEFLQVPLNFRHRLSLWKQRVIKTPTRWICSTNSYAVVKSDQTERLYNHHGEASFWYGDHPDRVQEIPGGLSLMNRNLASRSSLSLWRSVKTRPISVRTLMRKYRAYRGLYERPLPEVLAWSRPYVGMMGELMAELEPRRQVKI